MFVNITCLCVLFLLLLYITQILNIRSSAANALAIWFSSFQWNTLQIKH